MYYIKTLYFNADVFFDHYCGRVLGAEERYVSQLSEQKQQQSFT